MNKKQYLYSNLFAWSLVLFLIANHIFGWTIPSQDPPGGNIVLESGATPAGSTGYIQFNDAGNLGADSSLFWDNTNKYLGIGTANPGAKLEVNGNIITSAPTADDHVATKEYVDQRKDFTIIEGKSMTTGAWVKLGDFLFLGGTFPSGGGFCLTDTVSNEWCVKDGYVYKNGSLAYATTLFNAPTVSGYSIKKDYGQAYCTQCKNSIYISEAAGSWSYDKGDLCSTFANCVCTSTGRCTGTCVVGWVKCALPYIGLRAR
jgi:hypothetical protein